MNLSMIMVSSANGKISRSNDAVIDWNSQDDLAWFKEITTKIGTVVMGRKTYEIIGHPLKSRLNVVMSRKKSGLRNENILFVNGGPKIVVDTLEKMNVENAAIIGGKSVFTAFLQEGLIDEAYITYEPVFIKGIDMFETNNDVKMEVVGIKNLRAGAFIVHYAFKSR